MALVSANLNDKATYGIIHQILVPEIRTFSRVFFPQNFAKSLFRTLMKVIRTIVATI